jgi:hypothetical protein
MTLLSLFVRVATMSSEALALILFVDRISLQRMDLSPLLSLLKLQRMAMNLMFREM